ncbi:MAG: class I SAM-dependent methyltransferase [Nitrospinae bacterium]|nr:class I SAM-dependent methyltransferase [Nitrospinota bacterium]
MGTGICAEGDREKWDKKFSVKDYIYGKEPTPFLKENVGLLKKGRALDVAAGEGRNSVFLAKEGFEVDALDISRAGLEKAMALARENGVAEKVHSMQADLDSYKFPEGVYDTIIMVNFTDRKLDGKLARALKPGGTMLYAARTLDFVRKQGNKFNTDYLWETNEVLDHFKIFFRAIKYEEDPNDPDCQVFFMGVRR